jgi:protein involved in polysaccharide export with SLBB domain
MSQPAVTVDEWDMAVPQGDAELLAELRRHGVRPGRRLRVQVVEEQPASTTAQVFRGSLAGFPEPSWEGFERAEAAAREDFGAP